MNEETGNLKMTAIFCDKCDKILNVLSGEVSPLYIDKKCECGSMGFYTQKISIKILVNKPDKEPFFKWDGMNFYK
jgi:phage FluMu protein Com